MTCFDIDFALLSFQLSHPIQLYRLSISMSYQKSDLKDPIPCHITKQEIPLDMEWIFYENLDRILDGETVYMGKSPEPSLIYVTQQQPKKPMKERLRIAYHNYKIIFEPPKMHLSNMAKKIIFFTLYFTFAFCSLAWCLYKDIELKRQGQI